MATQGDLSFDPAELRRKYLAERDKRLRLDAEGQYIAATGDYEAFAADPYIETPIAREPLDEEIDVLVVGGGFGGLLTASRLRDAGVEDFRIIEQGGDFGGTWYWNRYPGVRCDIESYVYMPLLEEVGTVPSERYAQGSEIFAHCQAIGRHYDLYPNALFQTRVTRLEWDEAAQRWAVQTDRGDRIRARHVAVSQGPLAKVKLPGIPGIKDFKGKIFHSSRWDYDYSGGDASGGHTGLNGKRVAVIGTGATAVQIVPTIAPSVDHLYVVQRTPSAVGPRNNRPTDADWLRGQGAGWQHDRMTNFLSVITSQPRGGDVVKDCWTDFFVRVGDAMKDNAASGRNAPRPEVVQGVDYAKMGEIRDWTHSVVRDAATAEALKPWYNYLCKRPLFSDDFLQAFNRDNVSLVDTNGQGVEAITETGFVVGGVEHPADCIIFATGFDVGATPEKVGGYELRGRDGLTLDRKWAGGYRTVHGMLLNGFPNFYIVGAHIQGTKAFNFTHTLAMQAEHAVDLIARNLEEGVGLEVTAEAEQRWLEVIEARQVDQTKFNEDCTPGFLNNEGDFKGKGTFIGVTYGGGPLEWQRIAREWRETGYREDTVITALDQKAKPVSLRAAG
ncbi:NAD(P)/FAD-dependent oxidoreductase [soil metagenome]